MERKRSPLGDLTNEAGDVLPRRRARLSQHVSDASAAATEGDEATSHGAFSAAKVAVQRFSLVSRDAPPAARAPARHSVLHAPPRLAALLGPRIQVCRCSQCPSAGPPSVPLSANGSPSTPGYVARRARLCRLDTEAHPEYELLLAMNKRFQAECPVRGDGMLVGEACCREKTAYFILGPGTTTVGYVAAVVAANHRVIRAHNGSPPCLPEAPSDTPLLLQVWVEPEFRRRGFATAALALLLRGHASLLMDDPTWPVLRMLENLGFAAAGARDGVEGRPLVTLVRGAAGA